MKTAALFRFKVWPDAGEPFELEAGSRDVQLWEKTNHGKTWDGLMANLNMTDLYALAHIAARRRQLFTDDLKAFTETCELEFIPGEEPDPTSGGA